jgi:UDP-3-O-[3-hydroxymyristoyl] glucosamine N-acyltransferase
MTVNLKQIADLVSGEIVGDPGTVVSGVSSIPEAGPGDLVFADSRHHLKDAERSAAAAVLTRHGADTLEKPFVRVNDPRAAFAAVLGLFAPKPNAAPGIDPTARVAPTAEIAAGCSVGFQSHVGERSAIGRGSVLLPFAFVAEGVTIGEDCIIYPHVTLYPGTHLGNRVIVHSGSVIGADGFGYNQIDGKHIKIPHIGGVIIEDDVELGANVTVDRARTGFTEIGSGTKIDNLVHVAHNVKVGRDCIIIAQVGISGSVQIGDRALLAGQAGVKDHVSIGDGAQVAARAGIISDVPAGAKVAGFPARRYGDQMRIWASVSRLPDIMRQVHDLQARIAELEEALGRDRAE